MKTLLSIAVFAALAVTVGPSFQSTGALAGQGKAIYSGFTFTTGGCELGPAYCEMRKPKEWREREIETVKNAIDEIAARPYGAAILARTQEAGFRTLRRYTFGGTRDTKTKTPIPIPAADAQLHHASDATAIDFNDKFFRAPNERDLFSGNPGYVLTAKIFLHECLHAIDRWSSTQDFSRLTGFVQLGGEWVLGPYSERELAEYARFSTELDRLNEIGDPAAVWRHSRAFALGMKPVRVPAMNAKNPKEAFAEIGAHLIIDDNARKYLPSAVVAFFDAEVFR